MHALRSRNIWKNNETQSHWIVAIPKSDWILSRLCCDNPQIWLDFSSITMSKTNPQIWLDFTSITLWQSPNLTGFYLDYVAQTNPQIWLDFPRLRCPKLIPKSDWIFLDYVVTTISIYILVAQLAGEAIKTSGSSIDDQWNSTPQVEVMARIAGLCRLWSLRALWSCSH